MNFRNLIKSVDRKERAFNAFGSEIIIREMSGEDSLNMLVAESLFDQYYLIFCNCVDQPEGEELTREMLSNLCKTHLDEVATVVNAVVKLSNMEAVNETDSTKKN